MKQFYRIYKIEKENTKNLLDSTHTFIIATEDEFIDRAEAEEWIEENGEKHLEYTLVQVLANPYRVF